MWRLLTARPIGWAPALFAAALYAQPAFAQSDTQPETPEFLTAASQLGKRLADAGIKVQP